MVGLVAFVVGMMLSMLGMQRLPRGSGQDACRIALIICFFAALVAAFCQLYVSVAVDVVTIIIAAIALLAWFVILSQFSKEG